MKTAGVVGMLLLSASAAAWCVADESKHSAPECACGTDGCAPQGGLYPYGGGLLNWWPRCCFPCCGVPDDYCRKPLPCVCWPMYPSYYTFGPPDACRVECGEGECR